MICAPIALVDRAGAVIGRGCRRRSPRRLLRQPSVSLADRTTPLLERGARCCTRRRTAGKPHSHSPHSESATAAVRVVGHAAVRAVLTSNHEDGIIQVGPHRRGANDAIGRRLESELPVAQLCSRPTSGSSCGWTGATGSRRRERLDDRRGTTGVRRWSPGSGGWPTRARVDGVAGATRGGPGALNLEPAPPMTCCMQATPGALGARTEAWR
jgi:hypothetical protein